MSNLFYESLQLTEDDAYEQIYTDLSVKTDHWLSPSGEVRYSDKTDADIAASILNDIYPNVRIEPLDYDDGTDLSYHVTYSEDTNEEFDQDGLNWLEDKNPNGTPIGIGNPVSGGMGEAYEPADDEITCPHCGGNAEYIEGQGNFRFYKCLDCGEYLFQNHKGDVKRADDAFDADGNLLTEANGDDSFEAAQEYYASLEKPEQKEKLEELNNHFRDLGLDIVDFEQTIPSKNNNMYFKIIKLGGGDEVEKYEKAVLAELKKLGFENIDISQAINSDGNAYMHGGLFLDGMTLEEDTGDKPEEDQELDEAIEKHDELNQKLFDGEELKPEVKDKLLEIVDKFKENLEKDDVKLDIKDVVIIGSSASYNYTADSDIDLHIIADLSVYPNQEELAEKLYIAYKSLFNDKYDPTINGVPVEVYVEPFKGEE